MRGAAQSRAVWTPWRTPCTAVVPAVVTASVTVSASGSRGAAQSRALWTPWRAPEAAVAPALFAIGTACAAALLARSPITAGPPVVPLVFMSDTVNIPSYRYGEDGRN